MLLRVTSVTWPLRTGGCSEVFPVRELPVGCCGIFLPLLHSENLARQSWRDSRETGVCVSSSDHKQLEGQRMMPYSFLCEVPRGCTKQGTALYKVGLGVSLALRDRNVSFIFEGNRKQDWISTKASVEMTSSNWQ